jgi:hypothetical protein
LFPLRGFGRDSRRQRFVRRERCLGIGLNFSALIQRLVQRRWYDYWALAFRAKDSAA